MFDFYSGERESPEERRAIVAKHLARLGLTPEPENNGRRVIEDAARLAAMDAREGFAQVGGGVAVSLTLRRQLGLPVDDEGYDGMARE